ncbi:MAG: T9SS type A sorting domain-containing protein [Flavobacteriales bacterium]
MKNYTIKLFALMLFGFGINSFSATITENFDSFSGSGYTNHVYIGWNIIDGLAESASKAYLGSGKAVRLDDDNNAALQSPSKTGGVGTVSFWYRTWDGSPAISKVYLEISDDSLTWVRIDSIISLTNTAYTNYTKVVNSATAKFVQVVSSGEERFILDEFSITDNSIGCTGFFKDSISTTICSFDSVDFRGTFYSAAGIYKDTILSTCDTIFILNLMTTTLTSYNSFDTICSLDDSLLFNGIYLKTAGIYYDTISRIDDCDSVVNLNLFVKYCPIACTELFISEYIEGSSNNKALEFYNPSSLTIDLTQYKIVIFRSSNDTISLTGSVASGGVHVLSNPSAALIGIITDSDATAPIYFNGDDRIELLKGNVVIDRFGNVDVTGNFAKDFTFHRISSIQNGNTTFNVVDWVILPQDTDSLIGSHSSSCSMCTLTRDTVASSVCNGDSATNGVNYYSTTGFHSDTLVSVATGCDSIRVLDLTINLIVIDTTQDTICQGASILFGTQTLIMSGTYYDTAQTTLGCDSITVMELLVNDFIRDTMSDTICQGASILFGTQTLTMSGTYSDTSQTAMGCDSITVMELLVNDYIRDTVADTICQGVSVIFGTQALSVSGNYSDTVQTIAGCDSITVMELLVNVVLKDTVVDTICQGASIVFGTQNLTMSGTYSDTSQTAMGCDSITVMELLVNDFIRDTMSDTICQGASILFGTQTLTMSGTYPDTSQTAMGCDSITVMQLLVNVAPRDTIINSICSGDTMVFNSKNLTVAGFYSDTTQLLSGCDSITTIDLRFILIVRTDNIKLCPGLSYTVDTNLYTTTGTYTDVFTSASGCDSTVITNLSYFPNSIGNRGYLFCEGDSVLVLGNWYFTNSTVRDTINAGAANGCDSITVHTITTKTVSPALNLGPDVVLCATSGVTIFASSAYDSYAWSNGGTTNTLTVSGAISGVGSTDYILNVTQASSGCSATDTVNITFLSCVGLEENDIDLNVNLYPNPATEFVTIDIYNKFNTGNMKFEIVNSIGQIVSEKTIPNKKEKVIIDVTNFTKGLYFVRISSDKMYMTKKLLIQR